MDQSTPVSWDEEMVISKINAMRSKEGSSYLFSNYYRPPSPTAASVASAVTDSRDQRDQPSKKCINVREDLGCREKICQWTYSVIDHFGLSRQTVAISIDIFDRYFATKGHRCDTDLALLASLTTLYIAIKLNEKKKIKLSTLARLSRQQFTAEDIEQMEMEILKTLSWLVHPPTAADFMSHLIDLLQPSTSERTRHYIFELSRYTSELAVCDPYFIEHHKSTIALATILNVLEDEIPFDELSLECRENYLVGLTCTFQWFTLNIQAINRCRDRLRHLKWDQQESHMDDLQKRDRRAKSPDTTILEHNADLSP